MINQLSSNSIEISHNNDHHREIVKILKFSTLFLMMDPASFNMKMEAKSLEREARNMQKQAQKERTKAKQELKKGNKAAAQLYAQNAIRYEAQANTLLQGSAATNGYATDLRAGVVNAQMAQNMAKATSGLDRAVKKVDLQKICAQKTKMDGLKTKMSAANELLVGIGDSELETQAGTEDLLAQLEAENQQDAIMQIEQIPQGFPSQVNYDHQKMQGY